MSGGSGFDLLLCPVLSLVLFLSRPDDNGGREPFLLLSIAELGGSPFSLLGSRCRSVLIL